MRKILFLSAVMVSFLTSCSKDEETVIGPDPNDKYDSSITLTTTSIDLPAEVNSTAYVR